jgi:hypothetical protein
MSSPSWVINMDQYQTPNKNCIDVLGVNEWLEGTNVLNDGSVYTYSLTKFALVKGEVIEVHSSIKHQALLQVTVVGSESGVVTFTVGDNTYTNKGLNHEQS